MDANTPTGEDTEMVRSLTEREVLLQRIRSAYRFSEQEAVDFVDMFGQRAEANGEGEA